MRILVGLFNRVKNPHESIYLLFYRFGREVSAHLSRLIAKRNEKSVNRNSKYKPLYIQTYDGSGQVVHPDIIHWSNQNWLVCTPYPYAIELNENPCIYNNTEAKEWVVPKGGGNPLAYPQKRGIGNHISDPCIVAFDSQLHVYYRDTYTDDKKKIQYLKRLSSSDGIRWSIPVVVMQSDTDSLISPAVLTCGDHFFMFHVRLDNPWGGTIVLCKSSGGIIWGGEEEVQVENIPEGMIIWHISIMTKDGYGKAIELNDNSDTVKQSDYDACGDLLGLFLLRGLNTKDVYRLYWATAQGTGLHWQIAEELSIPTALQEQIDIFYKSAVLPETGDVLLSGSDNKGRWYLYLIPKNESILEGENRNDTN